MSNYAQNLVFNGLGTLSLSVPDAALYVVSGKISLPTLVNGGGESALVVEVQQNSSSKYTGEPGAEGFSVELSCAVGDVIDIIFSSSAAADQGLNVIKSAISISGGQ